MSIRLGVAPIAWSNDDLPELGGETSLEVCLSESREAGFSGTETGGKFPMDPEVLGPTLEQHRLKLVSGWFSGRLRELSVDEEKRRMERQLSTFAALGAPVLVYGETSETIQNQQKVPLSRRPQMPEHEYPRYGAKLTEIAEYTAAHGVALAYHHHMGTVVQSQEDTDRLMANTGGAVGLLVDTGHMVFAGGDPLATLRRHGHRVVHVHCKDVRADILRRVRAEDCSFLDAVLAGVFTVPGDGSIDFQSVAEGLAEIDYSGWVVVEAEQDPLQAPPLQYARIGHRHLSEVFTTAGFEIGQ